MKTKKTNLSSPEMREELTGKANIKRAKKKLLEIKPTVNKKWYKCSDYFSIPLTLDFRIEFKESATSQEVLERFKTYTIMKYPEK